MMRYTLIFAVTIFAMSVSNGQTIRRQETESTEAFIKRVMPDTTELAHPLIETRTWHATSKAIIAFYGYDDPRDMNSGYNLIFGQLDKVSEYLLMEKGGGRHLISTLVLFIDSKEILKYNLNNISGQDMIKRIEFYKK